MVSEAERQTRRRALVTGGANGIGWATCRRLAAAGYRVALADIDGEAALARAGDLGEGHVALQVDLTDRTAASGLPGEAAAVLGGLDVIVNNAGVTDTTGQPVVALPETSFQKLVDLNLSAVETICASASDLLPAGSSIVNLASGASFRPLALRGPYSATKAGIAALTKAYGAVLADRGISVSAVAPGYTRTPLVEALARAGRVDLEKVAAAIPMGRLATPEDIAALVEFAASSEGRVLSGETVLADGGGSAGPPVIGSAPSAGKEQVGRIAVIGGGRSFNDTLPDDIVPLADAAQITGAGPLAAVIDFGLLDGQPGAVRTLSHIRDTARACAAHPTRTTGFSLLCVLGNGHTPETASATAAGEMLARTIALEWAPSGMRVNALRWRGPSRDGLEPLCRFLVGEDAAIVTGQAIEAGPWAHAGHE